MNGPEAVAMIGFTAVVGGTIISVTKLIVNARVTRGEKPTMSASSDARLERIEQAVEAIALEVERVSEAQRFTTKLLAERAPTTPPRSEAPNVR